MLGKFTLPSNRQLCTDVVQMVDDFLLEKYRVRWTIFCSYPFYWMENWLLQISAEFQFLHLKMTDNLYSQTEAQIPTINNGTINNTIKA